MKRQNKRTFRRPVKAAESYGWVVESWEAQEAYEFACERLGKEYVDEEIIQGLSTDELAESLAYLFRMNEFDEWYDYKGGDVEASTRRSGRPIMASAWKAPNGKKYGKQTRRFPGKYLFTRRELRDMVASGIAEDMAGTFDPMAMNYDIIGISWNDTNGYRSGILIQDRDTGELYVGNSGDAMVAKL